jgi:hypothetical protein
MDLELRHGLFAIVIDGDSLHDDALKGQNWKSLGQQGA